MLAGTELPINQLLTAFKQSELKLAGTIHTKFDKI